MDRRLSAALRAHASGVEPYPPVGPPVGPVPRPRPSAAASPRRGPAHAKPPPAAWRVLALAVLLGAMAGGLAGVISIW
jgi:hypothetical protein